MIKLSSPGVLKAVLGLPGLRGLDTIDTVSASSSDTAAFTVANEAATAGAETIDGLVYAAGEAVAVDITALTGITRGTYTLFLDCTFTGGGRELHEFPVLIRDYFPAQ